MVIYLAISAAVLLLLGILWNRNDGSNVVIKFSLLGLAIWGWILVFMAMGLVVQR